MSLRNMVILKAMVPQIRIISKQNRYLALSSRILKGIITQDDLS